MINIEIYTDGSCTQQTGLGGWAYLILEDGEVKFENNGAEKETTNNKCEMLGIIEALDFLSTRVFFEPVSVTVYSDSAYIVNGFLKDWIGTWMKNGWVNTEKKPVANKELWEHLIFYQKKFNINFVNIKRRSNEYAEKVDDMAVAAKITLKGQ